MLLLNMFCNLLIRAAIMLSKTSSTSLTATKFCCNALPA